MRFFVSLLLSALLAACGSEPTHVRPSLGLNGKEATSSKAEWEKQIEALKKKNAELSNNGHRLEIASSEYLGSLALFEEALGNFQKAVDAFYEALAQGKKANLAALSAVVGEEYETLSHYIKSLEEAHLKILNGLLAANGQFTNAPDPKRNEALRLFQSELQSANHRLANLRKLLILTRNRVQEEAAKAFDKLEPIAVSSTTP